MELNFYARSCFALSSAEFLASLQSIFPSHKVRIYVYMYVLQRFIRSAFYVIILNSRNKCCRCLSMCRDMKCKIIDVI